MGYKLVSEIVLSVGPHHVGLKSVIRTELQEYKAMQNKRHKVPENGQSTADTWANSVPCVIKRWNVLLRHQYDAS
jgi:hypothetical protein